MPAFVAFGDGMHLRMAISAKIFENKNISDKDYVAICESLASPLMIEQGPYGIGVFDEATCYRDHDLLIGSGLDGRWSMVITREGQVVRLSLIDKIERDIARTKLGKKDYVGASVTIPYSNNLKDLLLKSEIADLVALTLLDQLPMIGVLRKPLNEAEFVGGRPLKTAPGVTAPAIWQRSIVYQLNWTTDHPHWQADITGYASLDPSTIRADLVKWKIELRHNGAGAMYWHTEQGRGGSAAKFAKTLNSSVKYFESLGQQKPVPKVREKAVAPSPTPVSPAPEVHHEVFARSLLYSRFGLVVGADGYFLAQTKQFGFGFEKRDGMFNGLRISGDYVPEVRDHIEGSGDPAFEGQTIKFEWNRTMIGYSIGFRPIWFIDRIDLTPKIGRYTFVAYLPLYDDDGNIGEIYEFDAKGLISAGYEIGADFTYWRFLVRGWIGQDMAVKLLPGNEIGRIHASKTGLDIHFKIMNFSATSGLTGLGFANIESATLPESDESKNGKGIEIQSSTFGVGVGAFF